MQLKQQAQKIIERFDEVEAQLIRPDILSDGKKFKEFSRTRKSLEESATASHLYVSLCNDRDEWERILRDPSDPEMQKAASGEIDQIDKTLADMEDRLRFLLVPRDARDASNAILEIRGGTGGDEASLFAGDLFKMYRYYCEGRGWKVHVLSFSEGTMGGYKEIIAEIEGSDVYGTLKFESGVHRVQRVPATEAQGRIHTSASTVAIMAEAEEVDDVEINTEDLRIDTYRSSGSGGQHVNKTDSAVRITHLPTGVVVSCQDEKSQIKNRDKAMKVLRSRLLDEKIAKAERERAAERKTQVGTGDRSGKIRTYNYPQGRVTDHRINLTLYNLDAILKGDLKTIFDALATEAVAEKLRDLERTA